MSITDNLHMGTYLITPSLPLDLGLDILDLIERNQANITTEGGVGRDLIEAPTGAFHLEKEEGREGMREGGRERRRKGKRNI